MTTSPRPTFMCVGAGKAGTTWLWEMLRQHPNVFLPDEKEIHYFNEIAYEGTDVANPNARKPLTWYLRHFEAARSGQLCGEICPSYLWSHEAPARIQQFDPDMRIVVMLRDPVDRLFSSYLFGQQKGEIGRISFEEALERMDYLLERAPTCRSVERYIGLFGRPNVLVVFHHDVVSGPAEVLLQVENFLGLADFVPSDVTDRRNVTAASRYPRTTAALMRARVALKRHGLESAVDVGKRLRLVWFFRWFQAQVRPFAVRPSMSPATDNRLRKFFLEDVEGLERLLGQDLSRWKPPVSSRAGEPA